MTPAVVAAVKVVAAWFAKHAIVAAIVKTVLVNVALGAIQKSLAGSSRSGGSIDNMAINVTVRGTVEARRIVLGTKRVSGVLVFYGASSSYHDTTNDRLTYVIALAGHQVSAIRDIWFDTVRIASENIDSSGNITSGQFSGWGRVWKHLGEGGQGADTSMCSWFPAEWDTDHRLASIAYIAVSFFRSDVAYPQGAPQNIGALLDGALMYDPRQDSTVSGGSGSHRAANPSTWSFGSGAAPIGRNPALQTRWWLTGGSIVNDRTARLIAYGLADSDPRIEEDWIIASANVCDEALTGANATPDGDDVRYQCDLEAATDQTIRQVLTDILESMAGMCLTVKGKWRVKAGAYETPAHTLTELNIYDDFHVQDTDSHRDRYNAVTAKFIDAAAEYVEATTIPRTDSGYEAQDGGERIQIEIDLRGVTKRYQADRLAEIRLRRSRMQRRIVIPGARNLLKVSLGETFLFSHTRYGWVNRVHRVNSRQFEFTKESGRVTLTAQREDSAVYADIVTADYTTGTSLTDVFQLDGPATPTGFVAISQIGSIHFYWDVQTDYQDAVYELFEQDTSTPFLTATRIWSGITHNVTIKRDDKIARYYWLRRRSSNGKVSGTYPSGAGLVGRAVADWPAANALDTKAWTVGHQGTMGNYVSSHTDVSESTVILGGVGGEPLGPFDTAEPLWKCSSYEHDGTAGDGGWQNDGDLYNIDPTKTYRSCVWVRRNGTASGYFFHGCGGGNSKNIDNTVAGNPYFTTTGDGVLLSAMPASKWLLSVGYIHGSSFGTTPAGIGGLYDPDTGVTVDGIDYLEFKNAAGIAHQTHRAFLGYVSNSATRLHLARPRFEEVNGNEPTILALLGLTGTGMIAEGAASVLASATLAASHTFSSTGMGQSTSMLTTGAAYTNDTPETIDIEMAAWFWVSIVSNNAGAVAAAPTVSPRFDLSGVGGLYPDGSDIPLGNDTIANDTKAYNFSWVYNMTLAPGVTVTVRPQCNVYCDITAGTVSAALAGTARIAARKR